MPKAGVFAVKQGKILVKNIKKLYLQKKLSNINLKNIFYQSLVCKIIEL